MTHTAYNSTLKPGIPLKRSWLESKPRKKRKPKRVSKKKQYDKVLMPLWRKLVKENAGYKCEKCGREDRKLDSHHLWRKDIIALRWNPENGACLCSIPCHIWGKPDNPAAHDDVEGMRQLIKQKRGQAWYDRMHIQSLIKKGIAKVDVVMEKLWLEQELQRLKEEI